jgi:dolichol kinase
MKELPRRLWHIFAGLSLPVAGLLAPQDMFLPALLAITVAALVLDIVRLRSPRVNRRFVASFRILLREEEVTTLNGSTYLLIAASIVFVLCDKAIAATALAFAAVGDPVAGMVGERWGGQRVSCQEQKTSQAPGSSPNPRLRRAKGKSWEGSLACFATCLAVAVILAAIADVALRVVVVGAVCATVIEFLSLAVNDNLTIPLVAAGVMSLVYTIVV